MISLTKFDPSEIQNNPPDAAAGAETDNDEFSALLAAFAPVPPPVNAPVLPEAKAGTESIENIQIDTFERLGPPENNQPAVDAEPDLNSLRATVQKSTVQNVFARSDSGEMKEIFNQNKNLTPTVSQQPDAVSNQPSEISESVLDIKPALSQPNISEQPNQKLEFWENPATAPGPLKETLILNSPAPLNFDNDTDTIAGEFSPAEAFAGERAESKNETKPENGEKLAFRPDTEISESAAEAVSEFAAISDLTEKEVLKADKQQTTFFTSNDADNFTAGQTESFNKQTAPDFPVPEVSDFGEQVVTIFAENEVTDFTEQNVSQLTERKIDDLIENEAADFSSLEVSDFTSRETSNSTEQKLSNKKEIFDSAENEISHLIEKNLSGAKLTEKENLTASLPKLFREFSAHVRTAEPLSALEQTMVEQSSNAFVTEAINRKSSTAESISGVLPEAEFDDLPETEKKESLKQDRLTEIKTDIADFVRKNESGARLPELFRNVAEELKTPKFDVRFKQIAAEASTNFPTLEAPVLTNQIKSVVSGKTEIGSEDVKTDFEPPAFKGEAAEKKEIPGNAVRRQNEGFSIFERFLSSVSSEHGLIQNAPDKLPGESEKLFEQVLSHLETEVSAFVEKGDKTNILKLRLRPAELGAVEIRLETSPDGRLRLQLNTEIEATQQQLAEHSEQLREALESSGWQIERLEISFDSSSAAAAERFAGETLSRHHQHHQQQETYEQSRAFATGKDSSQIKNFESVSGSEDDSASNRLVNLRA